MKKPGLLIAAAGEGSVQSALAEAIGAIHEVEAVGLTAPYKSPTGWEE